MRAGVSEGSAQATSAVFLLDKPVGASSFAALSPIKKLLGSGKVGHTGTLDPFADGLLLALSGKLTRAAFLLDKADKTYEAVFRFGEETDTLDPEGEVIAHAPPPALTAIRGALSTFVGDVRQIPPAHSAVKVGGRRAYERARRGEQISLPERQITVYDFRILGWESPDLRVLIRCSGGTYIRSIARDLGLAVGSRAHCLKLRRTRIGSFDVRRAVVPADCRLEDGWEVRDFFSQMGIPLQTLDAETAASMRNGRPMNSIAGLTPAHTPFTLYLGPDARPAALVEVKQGKTAYRIVFD